MTENTKVKIADFSTRTDIIADLEITHSDGLITRQAYDVLRNAVNDNATFTVTETDDDYVTLAIGGHSFPFDVEIAKLEVREIVI